jgi:hypothetical protein
MRETRGAMQAAGSATMRGFSRLVGRNKSLGEPPEK